MSLARFAQCTVCFRSLAARRLCRRQSNSAQQKSDGVMAFSSWMEANSHLLKPPVANRQIFMDAIKVMVVGGPNKRSDYHLQWGEELFWQLKGNACVKIIQKGNVKRDVHLPAGYVWLLPGQIPHNPQRQADSVGFVFERERQLNELDAMQWFESPESLKLRYREWFHCHDLGTQLKSVIERYFRLENQCAKENKTDLGVKGLDADTASTPTPILCTVVPGEPFHLMDHLSTLGTGATHRIVDSEFVMDAHIGPCEATLTRGLDEDDGGVPTEAFVYQLEGGGSVVQHNSTKRFVDGDVALVKEPSTARIRLGDGAVAVTVSNRVAHKLTETDLQTSKMVDTPMAM